MNKKLTRRALFWAAPESGSPRCKAAVPPARARSCWLRCRSSPWSSLPLLNAKFLFLQEHVGGPVANWQCGKLTFSIVVSRDESRGYFCALIRRAQCQLAKWQSERPTSAGQCLSRGAVSGAVSFVSAGAVSRRRLSGAVSRIRVACPRPFEAMLPVAGKHLRLHSCSGFKCSIEMKRCLVQRNSRLPTLRLPQDAAALFGARCGG